MARFISVDPDERIYNFMSPYCYGANNPVFFIDKGGRGPSPGGIIVGSSPLDLMRAKAVAYQMIYEKSLEISREKAALGLAHPDWSYSTIYAAAQWNVLWGNMHTFLDIVGLIPGAGELADAVNGGIYVLEEDYENAGYSFLATIPFAGWAATGSKYAARIIKSAKGVDMALTYTKNVLGKIEFGSRSQLSRVIGKKAGHEAHHIVPWALGKNDVVQKAAESGFHLNDAVNGVNLKKYKKAAAEGTHSSHPAYNDWVESQLNKFAKEKGGDLSPAAAKKYLEEELIPTLKKHIDKADKSNGSLNDYFKKLNTATNSGVSDI